MDLTENLKKPVGWRKRKHILKYSVRATTETAAAAIEQLIEQMLIRLNGYYASSDFVCLYGVTDPYYHKSFTAFREPVEVTQCAVNEEYYISFLINLSFLGIQKSSNCLKPNRRHTDEVRQL